MRSRRFPLWIALLSALAVQFAVGWTLRPLRPVIDEFPPPPGPAGFTATAFGDSEFLFRVQTLWLQNFGDGGGRVKPLRDFDYARVVGWLRAVDDLDRRSDSIYVLGAQFFGALTDPASARTKVKLVADFFEQAGMADPDRRWPWMVWSAATSQRLVKDPDLARRTAADLLSLRADSAVPPWLPLMAIPLYKIAGDQGEADRLAADPDMIRRRNNELDELAKSKGLRNHPGGPP